LAKRREDARQGPLSVKLRNRLASGGRYWALTRLERTLLANDDSLRFVVPYVGRQLQFAEPPEGDDGPRFAPPQEGDDDGPRFAEPQEGDEQE